MYSQYWLRVFTFVALLFLGPGVAATVTSSSTPTSKCTVISTSTVTTMDSLIYDIYFRTWTSEVTLTSTLFVYVTPFNNGTTLTRYETGRHTAGASLDGRAETTAAMSFTTSIFVNSSMTDMPTPSEPQRSCLTQIQTVTYPQDIAVPAGPGPVTTLTTTAITVSTLFDYDYLVPATFQPILVEPTNAVLDVQPVSTKPKPLENVPAATIQPSKTKDSSGQSTAPALPQGTPLGSPIATSGGPGRPIPGEPMRPPGGIPALPANSPVTTTVVSPGELQTVSLPDLGAVIIQLSHSGIIISGAASMIIPGQQTTVNNVAISFDKSASFVIIDGSATFGLPPLTPATRPAPVVIGGTTVNIGEVATRLRPGEVTTINNLPISRDTSASFVVVGGTQTIPLLESTQESGPSAVIVGGTTVNISELASELEPGEVTTINNIPISKGSSGSFVIIGGTQTIPLLETTQTPGPSTVVIDGTTVNVSELASELEPDEMTVIGTMTISRDSSALIAGTTTIAIGAAASSVVIGGTMISPGALPSGFSFIPAIDGGGLLLPNGQTLMPGAMTTVSGIDVSLTPGETPVVVVEGSMSITASVTANGNNGNSINSGSGGFGQPTSTITGVLADFTGGAIASVDGVWDALCTLAMTSLFFGIVQHLFDVGH